MEDGVHGSTNKDHNRSQHNHMKMLQTQAPSSSYNHLTSPIPSNNHSRLITKQPHKIKIIHIVPPEIIQTDKANFRDLIQNLTGRSRSSYSSISPSNNGRVKKHHMPQVSSSSDINMNYLLGFGGSNSNSSNNTDFSSNEKLLDDPYDHPEQLSLDVTSDHEILNGEIQAKVEREEEIMVQNPFDTLEWGSMKDNDFENGFCIDGFLELDKWLSQDIKLPNLMPN